MLPAAADHVGPAAGAVGEGTATGPVAVPIRPLQFRELLDLPFALIQTRIRTLAALYAVAVAVATGVAVGMTVVISIATGGSDSGTFWGALVVTLICAWTLRMFVRGTTVPIGLAVVHRKPASRRGALQQLAAEAGALLGYQVMYTLVGIGVLLLGAPLLITLPLAAIWLCWLRARKFTLLPVVFDESATYRPAALRAKILAAGSEWQLVGLLLYLRGLLLVLIVPLLALGQTVSGVSGTHRWTVTVLIIAFALLVIALAEMVESATQVVVYVDKRCRREAWDITVPGEVTR